MLASLTDLSHAVACFRGLGRKPHLQMLEQCVPSLALAAPQPCNYKLSVGSSAT